MPFNGSGVYNPIGAPDFPAVAATTIRAAQYNNEINDIASALTNCVTRDGQSSATADLPMGGNKHTNVAAAALRTQYARAAEVQDGGLTLLSSVTGTNTITATAPLGLAAYATGQVFRFVSAGANTGAVTLNINSLGAEAVTKLGAIALEAEDIPAGAVIEVFYDGVRFQLLTLVANVAATAKAGPNNSAFSFRNYIINGGCQVAQRGPIALSAIANTTYCADRITVQAAGGSGLSGNGANAISGPGTRSGYIAGAIGCDWTNATMKIQTRLEAASVSMLSSKFIAVSGKVYHDLGSLRNCRVVIQKANSVDNFSGVTTLYTSSTFFAPSGSYTPFSYTLALGGSDATNGLLISVEDTAASTATGKTFAVGDLQLEEGKIATPFEVRPVGVELALCQRYYQVDVNGTFLCSGVAYSATLAVLAYRMATPMRAAPTLGYSAVGDFRVWGSFKQVNVTSLTNSGATTTAMRLDAGVASGLVAGEGATLEAYLGAARLTFSAEL